MKLSMLIYECVKNSINIPNNNFDYHSFLNGEFNNSPDYSSQINGVFEAVNLALARLFDSNKIPFMTEEIVPNGKFIRFSKGVIINVVKPFSRGYERIEFRSMESGKACLLLCCELPNKVIIEYKPFIKYFTQNDLSSIELNPDDETVVVDKNIELEKYGITDNMIPYIMEFVKGQLTEYIAPDLANLHNNRAEQYFQNITQVSTSFFQRNIKNSMKGIV